MTLDLHPIRKAGVIQDVAYMLNLLSKLVAGPECM